MAGTNWIFGFLSLKYIDIIGRRRILVGTVWGMALALTLAAVAFHWIRIDSELNVVSKDIGWPGIAVLLAIVVYVGFYASGLGDIAWQSNELFPMEVRALGTMMLSMTCWGCNIIISSTFPTLMKAITPSGAFGSYAGICFASWIAIITFMPEVAGMTLEEIRSIFSHGFGVRKSVQLAKKRRAEYKHRKTALQQMKVSLCLRLFMSFLVYK